MANRVLVGADCQVFINGRGYGLAVSSTIRSLTPTIPNTTIDAHAPHEFMPSQSVVRLSFVVYRAVSQGDWESFRLVSTMKLLPTETPIKVEIINRKTKQLLYKIENAIVEGQTWAMAAQKLVQGEVTLVARAHSNAFSETSESDIHYASSFFGSGLLE